MPSKEFEMAARSGAALRVQEAKERAEASRWWEWPCDESRNVRVDRDGYGQRKHRGRWWRSSRAEWDEKCGPIPPGMYVCHHCDNPPCNEIHHLFLGTAADNNADAVSKSRHHHGERHRNAKLSREQVEEIREKLARGAYRKELAVEFDVRASTIGKVARGDRWAPDGQSCRETSGRYKTRCKHGHELTAENLYFSPRGKRRCRACRARVSQERRKSDG